MKRSFVRLMSGLLAVVMLIGMPVVSRAYDLVDGITVTEADGTKVQVDSRCVHVPKHQYTTLTQTGYVIATCTTGGYAEYTCDRCGQKVYEYWGLLGHDYVAKAIEGTDNSTYTCSRCGVSFTARTWDPLKKDHHHEDGVATIRTEVVEPTHSFNGYGYTKETCSLNGTGCGYVQYSNYQAPKEHTYGDWYWETRPTETTYGYVRRNCTEAGCTAYERMQTNVLAAETKLGRIKTDLTVGYTDSTGSTIAIVLAKGTTFTGNTLENGYYKAHFDGVKLDIYGNTGSIDCYIKKDDVEEVRSDAGTVSTGMPHVQFRAQVRSDAQVDVYSGKETTSAPLQTKAGGTVLYIYLVQKDSNGDYWGRISASENQWVKLTENAGGTITRYASILPAYNFGDPATPLENTTVHRLADTGTVINQDIPVYNSKSTSAATVGTLKKGTKFEFHYQNLNGVSVSPFSTENGSTWGYIDADTIKGLNLTAPGYVLMDNVSLASNPKKENTSTTPAADSVIATGVVTSAIALRVRKEPIISVLNQVGSLPTGTKVELYEIGDANGATWGRIKYNGEDAWICMTYVQIQSGSTNGNTSTGAKANGVVANCSVAVNVRDIASVQGRLVSTIRVGTRVAITKLENGWGLVDGKGWVYMQYVNLDAGAEDAINNPNKGNDSNNNTNSGAITTYTNVKALGEVKTGKTADVYTGAVVNSSTKLLTLEQGNTFTIVDRTIADGVTWYKTTIGSVTGWVKDDGSSITLCKLTGSVSTGTLNVYESASQESAVRTVLTQGNAVTIEENGQVTDGVYVWGKLSVIGGWVQMNNLTLDVPDSNVITGTTVGKTAITGKTNGDTKVYKTANGGDKDVLMTLNANRTLTITYWYREGDLLRGKFTDGSITGWVNMSSINQDPVTAKVTVDVLNYYEDNGGEPSSTKVSDLNLRLNASTTVVQRTLVGGVVWGRVAARDKNNNFLYYWINLAGTDIGTYSLTPGTANDNNSNNNNNNNNSNSGNTGNTGTTTAATGTICNAEEVNVRSAAGVGNAKVTTLKKGTAVTVYEQTTVDNALWGRIDQGWVAMAYVDLSSKSNTGSSTVSSGSLSGNTILTSVPSGAIGVGFVNIKNLTVRSGAGLGYGQTGTLPLYTNVVIYEHVLKDGMIWGRCDQGWICTSYVTYTGTSVTGSGTAGTIARCFYTANVRSSAGIGNALVAKIMVNSRVEIYEQTTYSGETWGRTSLGWVNMQYVLEDGTIPTP